MKRIVIDLDDTLTDPACTLSYAENTPNYAVVKRLKEYKALGFEIAVQTARNMRTHENSIGKINAHTLPIIIDWLDRNDIPYDEIYVGKPWCGFEGFYVDDRAIRPDEFTSLCYDEIKSLTKIKG